MNESKKYEAIGRTICTLSYWWYALKFIFTVSLVVGVVLFILNYPLWIAPIVGVAVFLIYRAFWRLVFHVFYKMSRM